MSRNGKHLGNVGGFRVPGKKVVPTSGVRQAFDVGVKRLSAPFWMREGRGAAFLSGPPSVFPSSSCSSLLVLMRCGEPPWNGRGNAATHHERRPQKSDLRKFQCYKVTDVCNGPLCS